MAARNHPNLQRFLIANARPTGRQLGVGSYGSVEELEVSGVVCAGKKIHETLIEQGNFGAENIASRYEEECQLMSDLRHPHLVQFLGVCFLPNSTLPVLVMERLLTSLDELLEHNPYIPLSMKRSILADVARGLVYLHSRSPPVIHRDLSARNVLLNSAMVAKITDLGNARIVNFQPGQLARTLSRIPGTMVYMPPEAFEATSKYGPSLDIFSFGHLSLFTITQEFPGALLPYTYRDPENPRRRLARTEVQRRDEYIKLLHKQLGEQHPLVLLVKLCLDDEPSERPSAQELLQQLEGTRTQIEDPYQHLTKLEAIRILREKDQHIHTQIEASRTIRQELEALQTQMEELQLETSFQLTAKDAEISRLVEETKNFQADLKAKEAQIREMLSETEKRESEIHTLTAELRDLQSQLQKAQADVKASQTHIGDMGDETKQGEIEINGLTSKPKDLQSQLQKGQSGLPEKKAADSGGGAKAMGEGEGKGAERMVDEPPDQPEPATVPELRAKETEFGAEVQHKETEIHTRSTVIQAKPQHTSEIPKAADSGDGAKATGESEEKRPARIVDELPDQPEPAIMEHGESPPAPIKDPKIAEKEDKESGDVGGGAAVAAVSPVDLMAKVDISGELKADLMKELGDKKVKIRGEALQKVQAILASAKIIQPSLGELPEALKWTLWDSNKNLVVTTLGIISSLATAMGSDCSKFSKAFIPRVLRVLADSKPQVRQAAISCLNAWHAEITLVPFIEHEFISSALATKSPNLRTNLLTWLEEKLPMAVELPPKLSLIVPHLFSCLEDRSSDVRKKAQLVLPFVMAKVDYDTMLQHTDKLKPASKQLVQDHLDMHHAAAPYLPQAAAKQPPASASSTSSKDTIEKKDKANKVQKKEETKTKAAVPEDSGLGGDSGGGAGLKKTDLSSKHGEKHSEVTSSPIASAATLNSSTPHTKPQADENYATVVIRPRKTSTEGLREDFVTGTEVVGKYNFPGSAHHDLPFKRGDSLTIISKSKDPNWYKAKRHDGMEGMIPHIYVRKKLTGKASSSATSATVSRATHTGPRQAVKLQGMPWFHSDISRESAEELLKPYKNGNYLVRKSKNYKGDYTLCVSYGSKIEHYRMRRNDNYWVTVDNEQYFENLIKFVEHYQRDADGLCCRLKHPVVKKSGSIHYTVSVQDFEERGWAIPSSSIQKESLIGKGEFREVWLGEYKGQKVAMVMTKKLRDPMDRKTRLAEAAIMTALRHPNLVCLIGVTLDKLPIYLITEYMAKGSLLDYLRSRRRAEISNVNQLDFTRDVCKGMVYLESQNLVHRNLAATNVLIGDDNTAKVSDFRLTREELIKTERREKVLAKWTAPEALREMKFSTKSDVWSFGILLWEIYSYGRVPYTHLSVNKVLPRIERGYRMDAPGDCPDAIFQIMRACWDKDPSQRPNFARIESLLDSISV